MSILVAKSPILEMGLNISLGFTLKDGGVYVVD